MKTFCFRHFQIILSVIILNLLILPLSLSAQQEGTFKDSRDNRTYQWKKIGKKIWMAENLKIHTDAGSWYYNNDSVNQNSFGLLYDWKTASTACPKGWHLPSENEWNSMITAYGGANSAGGKLFQSDSANTKIQKKISETGKPLSTFLGGVRHTDGTFTGLGIWGGYWSATSADEGAKNFLFARGDKSIGVSTNDKGAGFSVRCVKK